VVDRFSLAFLGKKPILADVAVLKCLLQLSPLSYFTSG